MLYFINIYLNVYLKKFINRSCIFTIVVVVFRHKDQAPHKYMMLEQTLRQDPRLAEFS